eukprot:GHVU01172920.1.p1 GENE.GHVU01172920.1~~GHVU01172920.1.p1  ORF type:complete len:118 (+),score=16.79 GHVU01172920.1:139-492(+)
MTSSTLCMRPISPILTLPPVLLILRVPLALSVPFVPKGVFARGQRCLRQPDSPPPFTHSLSLTESSSPPPPPVRGVRVRVAVRRSRRTRRTAGMAGSSGKRRTTKWGRKQVQKAGGA